MILGASPERVLAIGREWGDAAADPGDLATLGNILRAKGEHHRALQVLGAALDHPATRGTVRHATLLSTLGTIYREVGDRPFSMVTASRHDGEQVVESEVLCPPRPHG